MDMTIHVYGAPTMGRNSTIYINCLPCKSSFIRRQEIKKDKICATFELGNRKYFWVLFFKMKNVSLYDCKQFEIYIYIYLR